MAKVPTHSETTDVGGGPVPLSGSAGVSAAPLILCARVADTALSEQRLRDCRNRSLPVSVLAARCVYFLRCHRPPDAAEWAKLQLLLQADQGLPEWPDEEWLLVTPRAGTLSPWASKARDILGNCGLSLVNRLERGIAWHVPQRLSLDAAQRTRLEALLCDAMLEELHDSSEDISGLFAEEPPRPLQRISLSPADPEGQLQQAAANLGGQLDRLELQRLLQLAAERGWPLSDAELMMFNQVNSEHCRHKIFNARWHSEGQQLPQSLFDMIRHTTACAPEGVLSAYHDNAAVFAGGDVVEQLQPQDGAYRLIPEQRNLLIKVETHNHPTAIAPHPGAGTGIGGEIRDEAAVGRGSRSKMGLCGFSVSHLRLPGSPQPWEEPASGTPPQLASPLQIMLEGPIGGAAFANEFGRPTLCGYFRSFECHNRGQEYGYHKPIMIAGGLGTVRSESLAEQSHAELPPCRLVVLGGPALLIGLGGGSASSRTAGSGDSAEDFASVQRQNPQMQRRCQEVIDRCCALGEDNPIELIHDVGAGGLANAMPELVREFGGAVLELRRIPTDDGSLSPLELWCNEAQERFVLAVSDRGWERFVAFCERERCPYAELGRSDHSGDLLLGDRLSEEPAVVSMPLQTLFSEAGCEPLELLSPPPPPDPLSAAVDLAQSARRLLHFPAVAAKHFLITIGDRTVGGLVCRDQMVGPWQVPVADAAVCSAGFSSLAGEAMAMGERSPLAVLDAPASARMAVGEALTNIACAAAGNLAAVRLSANWMAAADVPEQAGNLYRAVTAVGMELCPALGIAVPVGKDSLSMSTRWHQNGRQRQQLAPLSLIVSAFAAVGDLRRCLTPQLQRCSGARLLLIDLGGGRNRLGASCLAQVWGLSGGAVPDLDDAAGFRLFYDALQHCLQQNWLLAMHDRSDGGLFACLAEMAFAGRVGLAIELPAAMDAAAALFSEELGMVVQVPSEHLEAVRNCFAVAGWSRDVHDLGTHRDEQAMVFSHRGETVLEGSRADWQQDWQATSEALQAQRDDPQCAAEEHAAVADPADTGLLVRAEFALAPPQLMLSRPRIGVLREQGVNGQYEMAAAFTAAGCDCFDVHMSELVDSSDRSVLSRFHGLALAGGFSYGDVLGAGRGWAQVILNHPALREQFAEFFGDPKRFVLGICNGCQMLAQLRELIPGSDHWPEFRPNRSRQFESRLAMLRIEDSAAVLLQGMAGALLPVPVAHGEGRAHFSDSEQPGALQRQRAVVARYVDNGGAVAQRYPSNPSGSADGIAAVCNDDGRITLMMPHPERAFRNLQLSWCPPGCGDSGDHSPWLRLFANACAFAGG